MTHADDAEPQGHLTADDALDDQDGWLLVPASGTPLTDDDVQALRDADQR